MSNQHWVLEPHFLKHCYKGEYCKLKLYSGILWESLARNQIIQLIDMKTVLILRHAKSSWNDPLLSDHDRPLNKRGKRDAPYIGEFLKRRQLVPDLILSSTAKRARKTAQAVAKASGSDGTVEIITSFYHSEPNTYISQLADLPDIYQRVSSGPYTMAINWT